MKKNNYIKELKKDKANPFNKKKRAGFTLIEMVIVVAILAILASVAFVKYGKVQDEAKRSADYTNATSIATGVVLAQNDGNFTESTTVDDLVTKGYLSNNPKPQSVEADKFTIEIEKSGSNENILIKAGDKVFYPEKK